MANPQKATGITLREAVVKLPWTGVKAVELVAAVATTGSGRRRCLQIELQRCPSRKSRIPACRFGVRAKAANVRFVSVSFFWMRSSDHHRCNLCSRRSRTPLLQACGRTGKKLLCRRGVFVVVRLAFFCFLANRTVMRVLQTLSDFRKETPDDELCRGMPRRKQNAALQACPAPTPRRARNETGRPGTLRSWLMPHGVTHIRPSTRLSSERKPKGCARRHFYFLLSPDVPLSPAPYAFRLLWTHGSVIEKSTPCTSHTCTSEHKGVSTSAGGRVASAASPALPSSIFLLLDHGENIARAKKRVSPCSICTNIQQRSSQSVQWELSQTSPAASGPYTQSKANNQARPAPGPRAPLKVVAAFRKKRRQSPSVCTTTRTVDPPTTLRIFRNSPGFSARLAINPSRPPLKTAAPLGVSWPTRASWCVANTLLVPPRLPRSSTSGWPETHQEVPAARVIRKVRERLSRRPPAALLVVQASLVQDVAVVTVVLCVGGGRGTGGKRGAIRVGEE